MCVMDLYFIADDSKRMAPVGLPYMSKSGSVIRLQDLWLIAKVSDCTFEKIYG